MSSEAITRNDLKAVLDEVLPVEPSEYKKLLWTNTQGGQTSYSITANFSNYDVIEVEFNRVGGIYSFTMENSGSATFRLPYEGYFVTRTATISGNTMTIGNGGYFGTYNNTTVTNGASYAVPYKIYGIKYERVAPPQVDASTYVVEHGTDGQWTYRKWSDGTYEATYTASFALNAGTAWAGGYYHKTTYGLPLPSFATSWYLKSAQKSDSILSWCVGAQNESDGLHFIWQNGSAPAVSGENFVNTIVTICGNWQ